MLPQVAEEWLKSIEEYCRESHPSFQSEKKRGCLLLLLIPSVVNGVIKMLLVLSISLRYFTLYNLHFTTCEREREKTSAIAHRRTSCTEEKRESV